MAQAAGISNAFSGVNRLKRSFFDREAVRAAVRPARRKYLNWSGALIRKIARNSMRSRKRGTASPRGTPPNAHSGGHGALLRKLLYYAYDQAARSVVVGPIAFNPGDSVPAAHEFGSSRARRNGLRTIRRLGGFGEIDITNRRKPVVVHLKTQAMVDRANRLNETLYGPLRLPGLPPRPYMRPALAKAAPKLPRIWQNSVKAVTSGASGGTGN